MPESNTARFPSLTFFVEQYMPLRPIQRPPLDQQVKVVIHKTTCQEWRFLPGIFDGLRKPWYIFKYRP